MSDPILPVPPLRASRLREILRKADIDRAVFFGLLAKIWMVGVGPITAFLIVKHFSSAVQGYYYTFASLLALQVFVELGLGTVLVQFAAHEWSRLTLDEEGRIRGDEAAFSRLASLAQLAMRWYLAGAALVVTGLGGGGYWFFMSSPQKNVAWGAPWMMLCLLTGGTICLVPIWSILEGCNQVARLYTFRFYQALCTSLFTWIAILAGLKLWVVTVSSGVTLLAALVFIFAVYREFFRSLLTHQSIRDVIEWRRDILPMQWRIALSWVSGYLVFSLFTPVLFRYQGAVVAGQFGMTWAIIGTIGGIAGAWLAPKVPQFGILIARREYDELDRLLWRVTALVAAVVTMLTVCCWLCVYTLNELFPRIGSRLLGPLPVAIFLIAQAVMSLSMPFSAYLRAHKQEPLLGLSVAAGILTATSTVLLGKYYSVTGMAVGYLIVNLIITPLLFVKWAQCRRLWHSRSAIDSLAGALEAAR